MNLRRLSGMFSRHGSNAGWSVFEYAAYPALMLLATPLLLRALGAEGFGLWAFVTALGGFGGLASLGMGAATTRHIAGARGRAEGVDMVVLARQSLTIASVTAFAFSCCIVAFAPWLAEEPFARMGEPERVATAIRLAAMFLLLQQMDQVAAGVLKGFERFELAARMEAAARLLLVTTSVAVAMATQDTLLVIWGSLAATAVILLVRAALASAVLGAPLLRPALPGPATRELVQFGGWVWVQSLAAVLFGTMDRLIVGGLLGAAALANYSVCTQLAQQVHALPAAAMAFLMPLASRRQGSGSGLAGVRFPAIGANVLASVAIAMPLAIGAEWILRLWMGGDFAEGNATLLRWLVLAYFLLSINVATHLLLLGVGEARYVSFTNLLGGVLAGVGAWVLAPALGVAGVAIGRLLYGPAVLLNFVRLSRTAH
jgi:O-antigen/teichoic acid export membrane protein